MHILALFSLTALPLVSGCAQHANHYKPSHNLKRQAIAVNQTARAETNWSYDSSYDWGMISSDYEMCQMGTRQSPIALGLNQGLSHYHKPSFTGYSGSNVTGEFYNWGHGPAFTIYHEADDVSTLPSMTFDNETVYLTGWHIHSPADHSLGGDKSKSEIHLVHANSDGHARAVVAIRVDPGVAESPFLTQLPSPFPHYNDTMVYDNVDLSVLQVVREVNELQEFWTYKGSLTSPPCEEGIQWFVARTLLFTSVGQMQDILRVSTYSSRQEQEVWLHEINV